MAQSTHNRANLLRRKLILGGTAASTLPAIWTRPVVDAVVLPSHAVTSPPQACDPLTFGPITVGCAVGIQQQLVLTIDESGECPVLMIDDTTTELPQAGLVISTLLPDSDDIFYTLNVFPSELGATAANVVSIFHTCNGSGGAPPLNFGYPTVGVVPGNQGGSYEATMDVSVAADNLSVTLLATTFVLVP